MKNSMLEVKTVELLDHFFKECQHHGEILVAKGLIGLKDIEDFKSSAAGSRVISIGLPAYCILQPLLRSANANSEGIMLSNNTVLSTSTNGPKEVFFDWFLNPLLIIKDQIKAENLIEAEEDHLCKLVMFSGDPERMKNLNLGSPPESERKQAVPDAIARRLQGITKSISRYPTFRRSFDILLKSLSEELAKKSVGNQSSDGGNQSSDEFQVISR